MTYHDDAGHIEGPFPTWNKLVEVDPENVSAPFAIRGVYYIFDTLPGVRRGHHAHRKLEQLLTVPKGACTVLVDDGLEKRQFRLKSPREGLLLGPGVWREIFDFTPDCVLVVLASEPYDGSDSIRDDGELVSQ